jgi:hypothetical protein
MNRAIGTWLVLTLPLVFAGEPAEAARQLRLRRVVCEDGGVWVRPKPGGPIGINETRCDADLKVDGACTIFHECTLGIPCPDETFVAPVGKTVRLPPWGYGLRVRCRPPK